MLRVAVIFLGLVVIMSCGVAIAAWPGAAPRIHPTQRARELCVAYARIDAGTTPQSALAKLGLDMAAATKLSYLGVVEHFMRKDSFGFDSLAPAVQDCLAEQDRCTAFTFRSRDGAEMLLLMEGGRVAFKIISGRVAASRARLRMAER